MAAKEIDPARLSRQKVVLRQAISRSAELIWPHTLEHVGNGLTRAQKLLAEGFGVVVLINHFSLRDAQEVLKDVIFNQPGFRERRLVAPIAAHQSSPALGKLAGFFGIKTYPVFNEHTVRDGFAPAARRGEGVAQYISAAAENLSTGGTVLIAPQAGREPSLYPVRLRTIEFFIRQMERKHVANVGYLLVGMGFINETDYASSRVQGHNFGRSFTVKIGETYLQNEVRDQAAVSGLTIDQWIYRQFEPLVPPSYIQSEKPK